MAPKVQLAPMLGLTDRIFINCFYSEIGGFDEFLLPYMVAAENSLVKENILRKRMAGYLTDHHSTIPQILTNNANSMVYLANLLFDLGFPVVNLNVGCPQSFVTNRGRGAGLLIHIENLKKLLDQAVPHLKPALSVKTRLGFHSPDERVEIIKTLNQFPLKEVIIHARTAVQQYDGDPLTGPFIELLPLINAPVIYNGNIVSKTDLTNFALNNTQINGVMVGRGAFINPFIGWQLKGIEISPEDMKNRFNTFYYKLFNDYKQTTKSEQGLINHFKELWQYFAIPYEKSNEIINRLQRAQNLEGFCKEVDNVLKNMPRNNL